MRRFFFPLRFLAFFLVLVLLTVRLGSYADETFATPIEDVIFDVAFIAAAEGSGQTKPPLFKPKRAADLAFCETDALIPAYLPPVAVLTPHTPFRSWLDVCLDIFVPPDERA
jgi:hypothetical protein